MLGERAATPVLVAQRERASGIFMRGAARARVRALLHSTQCDILVILLAKYHARRNKFAPDVI